MPDRYSSQYREIVLAQIQAGTSTEARSLGRPASNAELAAARRRIADLEAEQAATRRASELFDRGRVVRPKDL